MGRKIRLYLAGPYGFSEAGRTFYYEKLIPMIEAAGCEVLDPWKLSNQKKIAEIQAMPYCLEKREAWSQLNKEIGANNEKLINQSDGLIAVLDGPDIDSGTASEIGYAYGRGKLILGYRGDFRLCSENEGSTINIQVEYFILQSGGSIVSSLDALKSEIENKFILKNPN